MKDREFFDRVSDRSGLTWRQSADVSRATLLALADQIDGSDARELASHLPSRLAQPLRAADNTVKQYDSAQFAWRVRQHSGLLPRQTAAGVTAVFSTLREAAPEAAGQAISELSERFPTA